MSIRNPATGTGDPRGRTPLSARRALTRQRLMDAAVSVFAEKGIAGASVEELCEAAGFTRGAFYSNFDSKDELCFALLQATAEHAITAVETALGGIDPAPRPSEELIEGAIDAFLQASPNDRAAVLLLAEMELHALRNPDFAEAYEALEQETHTLLTRVITEALESQKLTLALPIPQVVELLHGIHQSAQRTSLRRPGSPNPVATRLKVLLSALVR